MSRVHSWLATSKSACTKSSTPTCPPPVLKLSFTTQLSFPIKASIATKNFRHLVSDTSRLATAQHFRSMFCCLAKLKMARTPPSSNTRAMHQATPTTLRSANYSRHSAMPTSQSTCAARAARAVRSVTSKNLNHSMATTPLKQSPHNHGYSITKSAWSALVTPVSANFS